jgi:hypothetical protein
MSDPNQLTNEEASATATALDYYLDTLTKCSTHEEGEHGDETGCEGWGPQGKATLESALAKVYRMLGV